MPNQLQVWFCCMGRNVCVSSAAASWYSYHHRRCTEGEECNPTRNRGCHWTWTFKIFTPVPTTWSENYVCVGEEGSSLSWGSLELSWAWQLKYNAHYKNLPSLHPAQGLVGSRVLQSSLFIKQHLDWGIGALGLAYQLTAGPILLYQCVLQCLAFVLKARVNEIYIICEMKPKLLFMKTTQLWTAFIFLGCLQCFTLCSTDLGFGGKLQ